MSGSAKLKGGTVDRSAMERDTVEAYRRRTNPRFWYDDEADRRLVHPGKGCPMSYGDKALSKPVSRAEYRRMVQRNEITAEEDRANMVGGRYLELPNGDLCVENIGNRAATARDTISIKGLIEQLRDFNLESRNIIPEMEREIVSNEDKKLIERLKKQARIDKYGDIARFEPDKEKGCRPDETGGYTDDNTGGRVNRNSVRLTDEERDRGVFVRNTIVPYAQDDDGTMLFGCAADGEPVEDQLPITYHHHNELLRMRRQLPDDDTGRTMPVTRAYQHAAFCAQQAGEDACTDSISRTAPLGGSLTPGDVCVMDDRTDRCIPRSFEDRDDLKRWHKRFADTEEDFIKDKEFRRYMSSIKNKHGVDMKNSNQAARFVPNTSPPRNDAANQEEFYGGGYDSDNSQDDLSGMTDLTEMYYGN